MSYEITGCWCRFIFAARKGKSPDLLADNETERANNPMEIESISDLAGTEMELYEQNVRCFECFGVERHHKLPVKLTDDSLVALLRLGLRGQPEREYETRWERAKNRHSVPKLFGWQIGARQ